MLRMWGETEYNVHAEALYITYVCLGIHTRLWNAAKSLCANVLDGECGEEVCCMSPEASQIGVWCACVIGKTLIVVSKG